METEGGVLSLIALLIAITIYFPNRTLIRLNKNFVYQYNKNVKLFVNYNGLYYLYLLFVQCTLFSILVELMWQTNQYEITRPTSESTDSFIGRSKLKSLSASELFWSLKVRKCLKTHATCKSFSSEDSWTNVVTSRSPVTAQMECFGLTTGDRY